MKSKHKKGFTLIELLAVIVILAIIALIAVPVVMNIITKARKSAFKNSAYGILKAGELYYADQLLELDGMTEDKIFTFPNNTVGLDIKGSKPSDGSVIVTKDGEVAIGVTDGKYCITKGFEDTDVTVTEDVDNCSNPEIPALSKLTTTGTFTTVTSGETSEIKEVHKCAKDKTEGACAPGTEFAIKVNEKDIYRFFVLNDSGSKVTLIMDRNLGDDVAWYADVQDNGYGPVTALTYLQSQSSTWTNLPEMIISTFEDVNGVEKALARTFTMYSRLPKYSEIYAINNSEVLTNTPWLYMNLYTTGDDKPNSNGYFKDGYWTLTANSTNSTGARFVDYFGDMFSNDVDDDNGYGVRPVIELYK